MKRRSKAVMIDQAVIKSKAFICLKAQSPKALLLFYTKRKMESHKNKRGDVAWSISNNGDLVFTYADAMKFGLSRVQFRNAIDDLIEKGFLEITYQGAGAGDPSTFKLLERWQAYGTGNFNPAKPRRKNTAKDRGWALYNSNKKQKSSDERDTSLGVEKDTSSNNEAIIRVFEKTLAREISNAVIN